MPGAQRRCPPPGSCGRSALQRAELPRGTAHPSGSSTGSGPAAAAGSSGGLLPPTAAATARPRRPEAGPPPAPRSLPRRAADGSACYVRPDSPWFASIRLTRKKSSSNVAQKAEGSFDPEGGQRKGFSPGRLLTHGHVFQILETVFTLASSTALSASIHARIHPSLYEKQTSHGSHRAPQGPGPGRQRRGRGGSPGTPGYGGSPAPGTSPRRDRAARRQLRASRAFAEAPGAQPNFRQRADIAADGREKRQRGAARGKAAIPGTERRRAGGTKSTPHTSPGAGSSLRGKGRNKTARVKSGRVPGAALGQSSGGARTPRPGRARGQHRVGSPGDPRAEQRLPAPRCSST